MEMDGNSKSNSQLSFKTSNEVSEQKKEEVIDLEKLHRINQGKVSAWMMKGLIDVISRSGLSMGRLNHGDDDEEGEKQESKISSEWGAKDAAYQIFRNVAKPGYKYIEEEDLLHFMKKADADNAFLLFEGATETGKITRSSLKKWLVKVYQERKSLAHSLNDTKTTIEELNRLTSGVVLIVILKVWLLVMGLLTTQVLLFISSQLFLVVFIFGNTAKTVFDAIIFVFVMHPFDVGDRCVIDGVQMVVEEMNILTTVLRYDNEKIYYPNSVLATKPISNLYRSPEMSDSVEFAIDFSTSIKSIGDMKAKIKEYLESKPQYWRPSHSVLVKEIEDVNKMKMGLYVTHTINFQKSGDRSSRRCELVLELKKIFEEVGIAYRLLPHEVHLSNVGSPSSAAAGPT
ncbi:mechanosensitive ion channel protein 10-like [Syzygium oleosum]|uniref:mechanosensitive ion channel protein 10-like n=1 Tax=Syzygium oleosum TaxID=219896 RepID=UPI0024BB3C7B|nr:mechanosensitive ion channel protein 10-like [Syzygium oleosum]